MILALDLGTKTGWASHSPQTGIVTGTIEFQSGRFEGGGMRYLRFGQWLNGFTKNGGLDAIYFEEVRRHRGTTAAHVYGGLLGVLTSWCEDREIPYQGIPVGTIKRQATGRGNVDKDQMIAAANKAGIVTTSSDEADAYWILVHVLKRDMLA